MNISETGLGLDAHDLKIGTRLEGNLFFSRQSIKMEVEVVRADGIAGAKILNGADTLRRELYKNFPEEFQAMEMSEVSTASLKEEPEGKPHWFYAPGNYELFIVESKDRLVRAQISWHTRILAVESGQAPRSGTIAEECKEKPGHAKSTLIQWTRNVDESDAAKAMRIVENIPGLNPTLKEQLLQSISLRK